MLAIQRHGSEVTVRFVGAAGLMVRRFLGPAHQRDPRAFYAKRATSSCSTSTILTSELTGMNSFTPWQQ